MFVATDIPIPKPASFGLSIGLICREHRPAPSGYELDLLPSSSQVMVVADILRSALSRP